jgi:elongation factor P
MLTAQELKKGAFINYENAVHRVLENEYHKGAGKMGNFVHLKIKDVHTGRIHELKMDPHDKVEELAIERHKMKYLYEDAGGLCFMDPQSYEQISVPSEAIGDLKSYIKEDTEVEVIFYEGAPIHVSQPDRVVLEITSTGEGIKGDTDNVYKPATLENGMEVLVPQFIKNGDRIVIEVETGKYIERAK